MHYVDARYQGAYSDELYTSLFSEPVGSRGSQILQAILDRGGHRAL